MSRQGALLSAAVLLLLASPNLPISRGTPTCVEPGRSATTAMRPIDAEQAQPGARLPGLPARFVQNRGQWDEAAAFRSVHGPMTTWFGRRGWTLARAEQADETGAARGVAVRMEFEGGADRPPAGLAARVEQQSFHSEQGSFSHAATWDSLVYQDLYPGIDVVARTAHGGLEYDLKLDPGADLDDVIVRCDGAEGLSVTEDGALVMRTALGPLRSDPPLSWEALPNGERRLLASNYVPLGERRFGFDVPGRDPSLALVIDPGLGWATYLGSTSLDSATAVAADAAGNAVVAGYTLNGSFPSTTGVFDATHNGSRDVFVSCVASDGATLLASTFLGGSKDEEARAVALDDDGGVVVAGWTNSVNFPTTSGAIDNNYGGGVGTLRSDAFVARLDASLSTLAFGTYLGGDRDDFASSVAVDNDDTVLVAGKTSSSNWPTTAGAYDVSYNGGGAEVGDVFVARLAADGTSLLWSTYLGGGVDEFANGLAVAPDGAVTVAGWTSSADFPTTTGALDTTLGGTSDGFVAALAADGASLVRSTFLGGAFDESASALVIESDGSVDVVGTTLSSDFPVTAGAIQSTYAGGGFYGDGFIVRLDSAFSGLSWGTFLGGSSDDYLTGVCARDSDALLISGWTNSIDMPMSSDADDLQLGGTTDALLACVSPDTGTLTFGTYLGGPAPDKAYGVALAADGHVLVVGSSSSSAFPVTAGSFDTDFSGWEGILSDAFVASFDIGIEPAAPITAWSDVGYSLVGTAGQAPELSATGDLTPGSSGVATIENALPNQPALVMVGHLVALLPVKGGTLVPYPLLGIFTTTTDGIGGISMPYVWPTYVPSGIALYAQAWVLDPAGPQGWSFSNCIEGVTP